MNEPLKPEAEQALTLALQTGLGETRGMHVAMMLWPLIRDMVLEAAATACEDRARRLSSVSIKGEFQARVCLEDAQAIRDLMGSR